MKKSRTYMAALVVCSIISSILLYKNYIQINRMKEKQRQLYLIQEETKDKRFPIKQFGYTDILKTLNFKDAVKIERFNQLEEENVANVSIQISGDIIKVNEILRSIQDNENFKELNNIHLEKDGNGNVNTKANIDFIKNK